jgi:hypothetical protein
MATSDNEAVVRRHFEEVSVALARPCLDEVLAPAYVDHTARRGRS